MLSTYCILSYGTSSRPLSLDSIEFLPIPLSSFPRPTVLQPVHSGSPLSVPQPDKTEDVYHRSGHCHAKPGSALRYGRRTAPWQGCDDEMTRVAGRSCATWLGLWKVFFCPALPPLQSALISELRRVGGPVCGPCGSVWMWMNTLGDCFSGMTSLRERTNGQAARS